MGRNKDNNQNSEKVVAKAGTTVCTVRLLDGTTFELAMPKKASGKHLFEEVCSYVNVLEKDYFGLSYLDLQDNKFWLEPDKKISKQLNNRPWLFNFEVKFYPPDPSALQEDISRYQLCLQLRHDILENRLPCTAVTTAVLGSYTVQAELGDWEPQEHGLNSEYIKNFHFGPEESSDLHDKICDLHKTHKGQTPAEAELHFLENAKKLALYGVEMHQAQDLDGNEVMLGVCSSGLVIYRDRVRTHRFSWPKILKISYKRKKFFIKARPGELEKLHVALVFVMNSHRLSKRLWKSLVEHHAFFRLKEPEQEKRSSIFFPRFGSRFRYSGRTQYQTKQHTLAVDRPQPLFERAATKRGLRQEGRQGRSPPREASPDSVVQNGVEPDGREWYRDAAGKKVYKTTTTTTTTTRYIVDPQESAPESPEPREQPPMSAERAEKKLSLSRISPSEEIDYDTELRAAILNVTGMNDDLAVEKIQLKTDTIDSNTYDADQQE